MIQGTYSFIFRNDVIVKYIIKLFAIFRGSKCLDIEKISCLKTISLKNILTLALSMLAYENVEAYKQMILPVFE